MNRLAKIVLTAVAAAALALPAGAQARHGADDPAGHVRHASHHTSSSGAASHRSRHRHRHGHHHSRHHARHNDDGPNHT
jgi:Ni/Co efflux regulator RcnB